MHFKSQSQNNLFFKFIPFLSMILLVALFSSLSYWQLQRAHFKQNMLDKIEQRINSPALTLPEILQKKDQEYYPIILKGYFENDHQFFLDNKFYNHQIGYQVITPFKLLNSDKLVLINRGWVAAPSNRQTLPNIPSINGLQSVTGMISMAQNNLLVGENFEANQTWPKRLQKIDIPMISKLLQNPLYPWVILQDKKDKTGFTRDWQFVTVNPEKNIGYAVQWLLMALTLIVIYIALAIKRRKNNQQ